MQGAHLILIQQVERRMASRQWSINRLADSAGVGRGAMSEILSDKRSPSLQTIEKIALALEVEVRVLFTPIQPVVTADFRSRSN